MSIVVVRIVLSPSSAASSLMSTIFFLLRAGPSHSAGEQLFFAVSGHSWMCWQRTVIVSRQMAFILSPMAWHFLAFDLLQPPWPQPIDVESLQHLVAPAFDLIDALPIGDGMSSIELIAQHREVVVGRAGRCHASAQAQGGTEAVGKIHGNLGRVF